MDRDKEAKEILESFESKKIQNSICFGATIAMIVIVYTIVIAAFSKQGPGLF